MIEFYVNNKEVLLPEDFSFELNDENPEITSKGEFSLDMTVSLLEPQNVIVFEFLNRLNKSTTLKTADALLRRNGVSHLGTIIDIVNTDVDVTFQYVAGNSELKYNVKADNRKIWELTGWGTESTVNYARVLDSITNPSWTKNFVAAPLIIGGQVYNNYTLNEGALNVPSTITGISNFIMQPYLLYYINKFPELLGYRLVSNVLNTNLRAQKMWMLNSADSLNYADALPDWTIAEFVDNIEGFFNVSFLVDPLNKTISIESLASSMAKKKTVTISKVLDAYERNLPNTSRPLRFDFTRVIYKVGDSTYFRYQQLSDSVLEKCTIIEYANLTAMQNALWDTGNLNALIIHRDLATGNDYFYGAPNINLYRVNCGSFNYLNLINKFSTNGTKEKILELSIVPAEMNIKTRDVVWYNVSGQEIHFPWLHYQLPKCSNSYYIGSEQGFVDTVEKSIKTVQRQSIMEVALFTGKLLLYTQTDVIQNVPQIMYPFSHLDYYPEFGEPLDLGDRYAIFEAWKNTHFSPLATTTLRLIGPGGVVTEYHQESILDTDNEYVFKAIDNPDIKANNLFIYNNKKYMPISFNRQVSNKQTTVLGKFYRMLD